jgi:hypothetical protein
VETLEYKNVRFTVWDVGGQVTSNGAHLLTYFEVEENMHVTNVPHLALRTRCDLYGETATTITTD